MQASLGWRTLSFLGRGHEWEERACGHEGGAIFLALHLECSHLLQHKLVVPRALRLWPAFGKRLADHWRIVLIVIVVNARDIAPICGNERQRLVLTSVCMWLIMQLETAHSQVDDEKQ